MFATFGRKYSTNLKYYYENFSKHFARGDWHFYPYTTLLQFSEFLIDELDSGRIPAGKILFADEGNCINRKQKIYKIRDIGTTLIKQTLYLVRMTVWKNLVEFGISKFLLLRADGWLISKMLINNVNTQVKVEEKPVHYQFQKERATCHTLHEAMDILTRIMSKGCEVSRPQHSSDLSYCDSFL